MVLAVYLRGGMIVVRSLGGPRRTKEILHARRSQECAVTIRPSWWHYRSGKCSAMTRVTASSEKHIHTLYTTSRASLALESE